MSFKSIWMTVQQFINVVVYYLMVAASAEKTNLSLLMCKELRQLCWRILCRQDAWGFGVYHFANGHRYEGAWHEGRRQGLGMCTFRNGETQAGHWQNGVPDTLSTQNTFPGSPIAVNHSKVLNAVQEARRAAEKAFDVPSVDDRVNKAAKAARVAAVKAVQKRSSGSGNDMPVPIV